MRRIMKEAPEEVGHDWCMSKRRCRTIKRGKGSKRMRRSKQTMRRKLEEEQARGVLGIYCLGATKSSE